jgi:pimeloyl-ACP methyl ester carboxylesterase
MPVVSAGAGGHAFDSADAGCRRGSDVRTIAPSLPTRTGPPSHVTRVARLDTALLLHSDVAARTPREGGGMSYATARDGTLLYYKDWGSGRPVVMTHGWPLSADTFDDLAMEIASIGMRAIAYDRRGFGRSEQPWEGYDYDTLADDLADVIADTNAHDAALIGFSMGGGEVARYMSRHAGRGVTQAILLASIVPYMMKDDTNPNGVEPSVFSEMAHAIKTDRAAFWPTFFRQFYGVGTLSHPVSEDVLHWSSAVAMQASLKATLACAEAFSATDFRPDLDAFRVPTLIVHGSADKTVPIDATARRAAVGIAGSTLKVYDGAPHGLFATHKTPLITDVVRFLLESGR